MHALVRWLLGLTHSPEMIEDGSWALRFQAVPEGATAVGYLALVGLVIVGVWWLYRIEGRTVSPLLRIGMVALRLIVLGCVACMLLELVIVITKKEQVPSQLLVLVDDSESMSLKDPYADQELADRTARAVSTTEDPLTPETLRDQTRAQLARRAVAGLVGPLADERQVILYRFSGGLEPLSADKLDALAANGTTSAVGDALSTALAAHRGQPLAGVLLVSDGQSNTGQDVRKAAEQAARDGILINTLAIGTEQGPSNARLVEIEASPVVFVRDSTEITVLYESRGLEGQPGTVLLEVQHDGGPWSDVGRDEVVFGTDSVLGRSSFHFAPEAIGQYQFRAGISQSSPELTTSDNTALKMVKVVRQRVRALMIAGYPAPEVQFLRNALLRDTALEFASWLQSASEGYEQAGHRPIRRLPKDLQELSHYDVVVLFDPDMKALGTGWADMLHNFVGAAGGGLVYIAGELNSQQLLSGGGEGGAVDNSWLRVLPVVSDPGLYQSTADVALSSREVWNLELTPEGSGDTIFRFSEDPSRNREILASLPGMYWHCPVTRAKPGATVLARHGDPRMHNSYGRHVLLASQRYGPGYTVFIGFDSTYRWRYLHEEYFDGFWARLVDRVGRNKALGGRYPFILSTDKAAYRPGDQVTLRAEWIEGGTGQTDLRGEVDVPGGEPITLELSPVPEKEGTVAATFNVEEAGPYLVRIVPATTEGDLANLRPATLDFRVDPRSQELDKPALDRALLDDVARAAGGQLFTLADYQQIADAFKIKQVERVLEYRDELWDAPLLFGLLMICLTTEWVLRKRSRMA
jgi:Protein of unknown function (DUF1194)